MRKEGVIGQSIAEKIARKHMTKGPDRSLHPGDVVSLKPRHVMTHDNTAAVIKKFRAIGADRMADPRQPVFPMDHDVQNRSESNLRKYRDIETFACAMGVDFYPPGTGISHQVMVSNGYVVPGSLVVGSDSHSDMYGALGALGTPVVRTDAAAIWATGRTWWQAPPVAKVNLTGKLRPGVAGKDVIITLCGYFNKDEVLNHAVEFSGDGVEGLSIDDRLAIANMTTEWGALVGLFPTDDVTISWLRMRSKFRSNRGKAGVPSDEDPNRLSPKNIGELNNNIMVADPDASYSVEINLDLATVSPHVSGPDHVKVFTSVTEMQEKKLKINKAYLLSCVNGRVEDLAAAASVIEGNTVAEGVELDVGAA